MVALDVAGLDSEKAKALYLLVEMGEQVQKAREHPANLLQYVKCVDQKTGERFEFQLIDPDDPWYWQRELLDWWIGTPKTLVLKARQLGVTWLAAGLALWYLLYRPGSAVLVYSMTEDDASAVVNRIWDMFESLPLHLRNGVQVLKPARGARPHTDVEVRHRDGRVSTINGMAATKRAGQGRTAALVVLDEQARQEYARETWKSVIPTMADGGRVLGISTANGVSNEKTGEGNFFHHAWTHAKDYNLQTRFLPWSLHPDRDEEWYRQHAMSLPPKDRAEQYPADANEAFILTGDLYFDEEALAWYAKNRLRKPLYEMAFTRLQRKAKRSIGSGPIQVFEEPKANVEYAIAADVATGRGLDYSAAYVVDLSTMAFAACLHGKLDADLYAFNLHYLGKWYHTARIAVEVGGGYGEAPIVFLRDGKDDRPPYPKLYRHRTRTRADFSESKPFGFPMNIHTRPLVLENLQRALRERSIPSIDQGLLSELQTFVYRNTNPSPRAQEGCNDDRVMAAAIALELYRDLAKTSRPKMSRPKPLYPWLAA